MPIEIDDITGKPTCFSAGTDEACSNFGRRCPKDKSEGCIFKLPVIRRGPGRAVLSIDDLRPPGKAMDGSGR